MAEVELIDDNNSGRDFDPGLLAVSVLLVIILSSLPIGLIF